MRRHEKELKIRAKKETGQFRDLTQRLEHVSKRVNERRTVTIDTELISQTTGLLTGKAGNSRRKNRQSRTDEDARAPVDSYGDRFPERRENLLSYFAFLSL